VTRNKIQIGNWIYWTLTFMTTDNWQSHWVTQFSKQCNYSTRNVVSVFYSCCLVVTPVADVLPNYSWLQQPSSHISQLQRYIAQACTNT
jgi:hypothetical protein